MMVFEISRASLAPTALAQRSYTASSPSSVLRLQKQPQALACFATTQPMTSAMTDTLRQARLGPYELCSASSVGMQFARHSHDECVIGVNLSGEEHVWLDRRTFHASRGDITFYNPGQIQGGGAKVGQAWSYVGLYVRQEQLAADLGLAGVEFERALCHLPPLAGALAGAIQGVFSADAFLRERAEEQLLMALADALAFNRTRMPVAVPVDQGLVTSVQEWLAECLQDAPDLEPLSAAFGVSKFQLLRAFQKETGLPPRQWTMQLRTRRARGLLRAGLPAVVIAHELGFADQSHFHRHFRAAYGMAPGAFQRALRD
jgi:AraC family chemosensory pili system transcriptional regulator ChpD